MTFESVLRGGERWGRGGGGGGGVITQSGLQGTTLEIVLRDGEWQGGGDGRRGDNSLVGHARQDTWN